MPASVPGQPHEPTIHPRTRPEANDYALKNRTTNDWLRHDGKNIEILPQPAPRTGVSKMALANAIKARGDAATWFQHDPNAPPQAKPPMRCPTPEAKIALDKVYGKKELWYKHDENMHYYDPVPNRLGASGGEEVKKKFVSPEASRRSMSWYMHEHRDDDGFRPDPVKHNTGPISQPMFDNERKIHGTGGAPDWYEHKWTPSSANNRPQPRVTMKEALDIYNKDRGGGSADWFDHDSTVHEVEPYQHCVRSKEGAEIAKRLSSESKNWFDHNTKVSDDLNGHSRKVSAAVQEMLEKDRNGMMKQVMNMDPGGQAAMPGHGGRAIKPEAEEIARHNTTGSMGQVFDHSANKNYVDPAFGGGRMVRPEAMQTFEKNKGVMADCMQGYRDPPWKKTTHKLPPDDAIVVKHSGSSMDHVMKGTGPPGSGRFHMARGVRPEAEAIAEKHKGSAMFDVFLAGHEDYVKKGPKVRSELAKEIAQKSRGYVPDLIR